MLISPAELESLEATLDVLSAPGPDLAEYRAGVRHSREHPEDTVTGEEFGVAYEHFEATGSWPDGWLG